MPKFIFGCLFFGVLFSLSAQNTSNPFELSPRLSPSEQSRLEQLEHALTDSMDKSSDNPFDLDRLTTTDTNKTAALSTNSGQTSSPNPFDLVVAPDIQSNSIAPDVREVRTNLNENEETTTPTPHSEGSLLSICLLLFAVTSLAFIFFRNLYLKAYRALFNDNLLSLLYREREAGSLGGFIITYIVFFMSSSLFLALVLKHFNLAPTVLSLWQLYGLCVAFLVSIFVTKHLLLALMGYIFPIRKETQRYSFTIMIFAVVLGLLLAFGAILLAYTPENVHVSVIYGLLGLIGLIYALRLLRGLFIANRFIFNYQFHFLSYICAVEIGPALCLLKLITDF